MEDWFAGPAGILATPLLDEFGKDLAGLTELAADERKVVFEAAERSLAQSLQLKLNRVFLLELHAASLAGLLPGDDPAGRWDAFVDRARTPAFLDELRSRYPVLHDRVAATGRQQLSAALLLATRLVADRADFAVLLGRAPGRLRSLQLNAGDPHRGGHAVAMLELDGGRVMYKPRPVEVDAALTAFLAGAQPPARTGGDGPLRLPGVLVRAGYGWAEYVDHRYCRDEAQLGAFYRGLGRWLAAMRLLGGTDLHAENLIADGPDPVVVDAETLFTPDPETPASGRGAAVDIAARMIRTTVLRTGILPLRTDGFALAGVDLSAAGALPGQQPRIRVPVIADAGTDSARVAIDVVDVPPARNHPHPEPVLIRHWDQVIVGFRELTEHLREMDARGELAPALRGFRGSLVRLIRRPTQSYVEIGRMLWHPASLHDPAAGLDRARDILRRNADALPGAPRDPETIDTEITDLLSGDIPVFTLLVDDALLDSMLTGWRTADFTREEDVIRSALVGAYLNERQLPARARVVTAAPRADALDRRRRAVAASAVRTLCEHAVLGDDGTATWVSPVLIKAGWAIRPLTPDLYSGQGGVALALAQYQCEQLAGRVDPVAAVGPTLHGALRVLTATEDLTRTEEIGGFTGLASQVWTWSALHQLLGEQWLLDRACERAGLLTSQVIGDDLALDVLSGSAGVIVPLLGLAELTGQERWLEVAVRAARRLERTALLDERGARWATTLAAEGIGGFAHGATGIGWALTRLALSPAGSPDDRRRWDHLAERAFAFESSLFDAGEGAWRDARIGSQTDFPTAWCHGSTGIGLAAADLHRRTGNPAHLAVARRSGPATLREGVGWSHTLCHGDLGLWELLAALRDGVPGYDGPSKATADAELISGIEDRGPVGGIAKEAFAPGLMPGLAGVVNLMLRMNPDHAVSSPLLQSLSPGGRP